jgi:hypothetical protein
MSDASDGDTSTVDTAGIAGTVVPSPPPPPHAETKRRIASDALRGVAAM